MHVYWMDCGEWFCTPGLQRGRLHWWNGSRWIVCLVTDSPRGVTEVNANDDAGNPAKVY
jgi:hypothetical protein